MTSAKSAVRSKARAAKKAASGETKAASRGRLAMLFSLVGLGMTVATTAYRLRGQWRPLASDLRAQMSQRRARKH